ncbi:hypothetical protein E3N88_37346 [Mikania micrantha]|uniref:Uncharacterized protein n=1 Tax=Mikania micrantha TaxID=192012 RepID=A0A5N6LQX8_9ASTR|nr:hypothetical protein E3N88_37346 [Mikania micrantha]
MEVPVGEHLRLDKYDSTMVDSQRCWQLSRWKYRWVNILDLINMTPQWWIARGAGNCLDGSTVPVGEHLRLDKYDSTMVDSQRCWQLSRWKYRWVNILDLINMTPQWWIDRGAVNCLRWKYRLVNILRLTKYDSTMVDRQRVDFTSDFVGLALDPLYFHVEDVGGYAWAKESLKLVEKQGSYGGLKMVKTLKWENRDFGLWRRR